MLLFFSLADSFFRSVRTSTICFDSCCTLELLDVTWSGSRILLLSLSLIVFISSSSCLRVAAFQYFAPRAAMLAADGSSLADKQRKSCCKNHLQSRGMGGTGSSFTPPYKPLRRILQFGNAVLAKPSETTAVCPEFDLQNKFRNKPTMPGPQPAHKSFRLHSGLTMDSKAMPAEAGLLAMATQKNTTAQI